jgi:thymidylate synthase
MNQLDKQYQELLFDIIENGVDKDTRNGKTRSVFGKQIRHKMKEGFPLLTTKKMYWKGIVTELIWFLRGETNIKFLVDNGCHIWDGDAYKNYCKIANSVEEPDYEIHVDDPDQNCTRVMTMEEFINKIKTDTEFAKKWGGLGPIYGKQWRNWGGKKEKYQQQRSYGGSFGGPTHVEYGELVEYNVPGTDQIKNLIRDLKTNPDSRRLMVNVWNVEELDSMTLPPCHYGFQVYTRELSLEERKVIAKKVLPILNTFLGNQSEEGWIEQCEKLNIPTRAISLMWNQRSVDTFLGLPFNIASYGLLLEIIAKEVNMVPDELIGNLGDTHIYEDHMSQARQQITREPYALPKLYINDEFWATENDVRHHDISVVINSMLQEDFQIENYQSHPAIKAPLST